MTQSGQKRLSGSPVRVLSAVVVLAGVVLSPQVRFAHAAGGDLDPAFDRDGRRVFVSSTSEDRGLAVAVQPNGKIVVVGDTDFFGTSDTLVMRFNVNGSADSTFDIDGRRIYDEPGAEDHGQAVAVQANGKLVVAGYSNLFGRNNALLLRFNPDGRLDPTFDRDGRRIFASGVEDRIQAVAIQLWDSKIVIAGYSNESGEDDILVMRFNANGSLDSSFHNDGRIVIRGPGNDRAQAIALQPDRKIVVAGYIGAAGSNDFRIVRLNANGSLDSRFADNGQTSIRGFGGDDRALAVALQPVGQETKIVMAGYTDVFGTDDFAVARLNADGTLDDSFSLSGRLIIDDRGDNRAQAIAVQADGKIVLAGYTNASGNNDFAVARLTVNGSLDGTFGTNGRVVTGFGKDDRALAAAISPIGGKIMAAGYTTEFGTKDVAVARYLPE
jgi:uncharacterized delta-60 repeat protein